MAAMDRNGTMLAASRGVCFTFAEYEIVTLNCFVF